MEACKRASLEAWEGLAQEVRGKAVLLDALAARSLHWSFGPSALYMAGATLVTHIEHIAWACREHKQMLVVVGGDFNTALPDLCKIASDSILEQLKVVCSSLPQDMQNSDRLTATLRSKVAPGTALQIQGKVDTGLSIAAMNEDLVLLSANKEDSWGVTACLVNLLDALQAKPVGELHMWTRGAESAKLVSDSKNWPRQRNIGECNVSLVVVDRNSDLACPLLREQDTLGDRMYSIFESLDECSSDIKINVTGLKPHSEEEKLQLIGCLSQPQCAAATPLLSSVIGDREKDGLLSVRKCIMETASKSNCKLPIKAKMGRATHKQLTGFLDVILKSKFDENQSILQVLHACVQAINPEVCASWERQVAEEKTLFGPTNDSEGAPKNIFSDLINLVPVPSLSATSLNKETLTRIKEVLQLAFAAILLDLSGEHTKQSETELLKILSRLLARGVEKSTEDIETELQHSFLTCKQISAKNHDEGISLTKTRSLQRYHPFFKQLSDQVFDAARGEVTLLEHHSAKDENIISSGFGMISGLMGGKKHPLDADVVVICVLGGIMGSEIKPFRESLSSSTKCPRVFFASTNGIATSSESLRLLLTPFLNTTLV
eukprot:m.71400 g.71400  ORF g.71400 m.71400 type:complete len:605 (-) comp12241_c0_seq2:103-1917(-)